MKKYVLMAVAAVLVAALLIAGCGKGGGGSVAEINGQKISYEAFAKQMSQSPQAQQVLSQMLEDRMVLGLADKEGVPPTDEQVNQQIDLLRKTIDLDTKVKEYGLTLDDVKDQLRTQQAKANIEEKISKTKVTDAEIKTQYDQNKERFELPERMKVQSITFQTKDAADKAYKAIEGGSSLEKIGEEGGSDHGPVRTDLVPKTGAGIPPELAKAAFDTPIGKVSQPVKITNQMFRQETYIILKPLEKVAPVTISEKEAAPVLKMQAYLTKSMSDPDFQKLVDGARKDAKVSVQLGTMKQVEKDFKNPPPPSFGMPGGGAPAPAPTPAPAPKK